MAFATVKYQTDAGTVIRMRVSTGIQALIGDAVAGAVDDPKIFAYVTGSKRKRTLRARRVYAVYSETTEGGLVASRRLTIPCVTQVAFNALAGQATVNYGGKVYNVVGADSEG